MHYFSPLENIYLLGAFRDTGVTRVGSFFTARSRDHLCTSAPYAIATHAKPDTKHNYTTQFAGYTLPCSLHILYSLFKHPQKLTVMHDFSPLETIYLLDAIPDTGMALAPSSGLRTRGHIRTGYLNRARIYIFSLSSVNFTMRRT